MFCSGLAAGFHSLFPRQDIGSIDGFHLYSQRSNLGFAFGQDLWAQISVWDVNNIDPCRHCGYCDNCDNDNRFNGDEMNLLIVLHSLQTMLG